MYDRISGFGRAVKEGFQRQGREIFMAVCLILAFIVSVGIYRLWTILDAREGVRFVDVSETANLDAESAYIKKFQAASALPGLFVASRKGKNYYYPWCSGVSRLKEANKIWFKSAKEAEAAGYKLASGCQ